MRNPITKLAAAAAVAIACVIGVSLWRSTSSGIALADVLDKLEQVTAYKYQMRLTRTRKGEGVTGDSVSISTVFVSREHGIRVAYRKADPNKGDIAVGDTYLLPRQTSIVFVDHKEKTYTLIKEDRGKISYYREEYNEPHTIIKQFLACDHISLGQSVIDGVTVEGFQTTDLAYKGGFFGQDDYFVGDYTKVDVKLWVDVKTFLPIRLEEDVVTSKETHIHQVCYDFRWNAILSAADFEPNIPDGYTAPIGDVIIPVTSEENTIKGLRLFADLTGKYPVGLTQETEEETRTEEFARLVGYDASYDTLSHDEKTRITNNSILVGMLWYFYEGLVSGNKDPAYYGETVKLGDADKVLLRWRLDDGQYRVIFGDLSAKTVTAEELAELETHRTE